LSKEGESRRAIEALSGSKKLSFRPEGLILGYLGQHGTVTGIVENFSFK